MNTLHIIGSKKSGKTTQVCYLIEQLTRRGYRVGSWKHSSHLHAVDKAGADSDRHRSSGAQPAVFQTPGALGIYYNLADAQEAVDLLNQVFRWSDLVLVESFRQADGPKLLITDDPAAAAGISNIKALISERDLTGEYPVLRPSSAQLVDFVERNFLPDGSSQI